MPADNNEPTFEYEKSYFDVQASIRYHTAQHNDKSVPPYSRWMHSRRLSDFQYRGEAQLANRHYVASVFINGNATHVVCVCGLKVDVSSLPFGGDYPDEVLCVQGHWNHVTGALAQILTIGEYDYCMGCSFSEKRVREHRGSDEPVELKLEAAKFELEHAGCGLQRFPRTLGHN